MKSIASSNNLDYNHYEKSGYWREIRAEPTIIPINCETCKTLIPEPKPNQRFCNQICKNKYHNSKKLC
ncbi:hypothetical protein VB776_16200 [Arcicella sp. DC2W]|uniref:DUF2116 family Zn-ribbon domain-containing protein n=1 Tax=Arcicella gelida TaxID=2984195 RepID=A0ABU5S7T9_9BACT|nr:hypothetical protein [Arcicella sp. DC2W]MEA5404475.1 hypothetical protein [Arcicella sp. DC2W]